MFTKEMLQSAIEQAEKYKVEYNTKGGLASASHLKSAQMDWNTECQWDKPSALIKPFYKGGNLAGLYFLTYTQRQPQHATLRHIVTMEPYRGCGLGTEMLNDLFAEINAHPTCNRLRIMADKTAVKFYEKNGFHWLGESKTGLPFTYCYVTDNNVQISNKNFVDNLENNLYTMRHELKGQFSKLAKSFYDLNEIESKFSPTLNFLGI